MYKVLLDDTLMCDSRIEELALINPVAKLEENKAGSFSFILPPGHPYYDSINKRKSIISVYIDDEAEPVFCGMCIEVKKDFYNQKTIYCEGELSFLNDSIQRPRRYQGYTVRGLLEAYIANHNAQVDESKRFTVGQVTVQDSNDYIFCYTNMENTMKAIKEDLVDDLGGIIRIRHEGGVRYIDYLAESPNTNSQVIRLGENLLDFTSNIDATDIATAIIPLGEKLEESAVDGLETRLTIESINDGLDYVHNADAIDSYGWIYKTVTYDDVTTPKALKRKGEQYLTETQFENVVIEAKVVDLHFADKAEERFKISDQCRVESTPHGMNKYFRLTKQTLNLNNPEKDKFTLGKNEKATLSSKSNAVSEEIKKVVESIVPPNHILNQAVANATALITSAMGGYVVKTNNELLIMDTDDIETAKKVWRWNINGLGYSSTGYEGPYTLAMTMDGKIVADFIYGAVTEAKTVKVENLTGETIRGFTIDGCRIISESDLHKAYIDAARLVLNREEEERVLIFASGGENDTGVVSLKSANGNQMSITADGIDYNNEGSGGEWGYIKIPGTLTAKNVDAQENIDAKGNIYANEWFIGTNAQIREWLIAKSATFSDNVTVGNEMNADSIVCNKMGIGGTTTEEVEWVWNSQMERWCLCKV